MRISLISPNLSGDTSILDMGLTYLATYLNQKTSHRAQIIDFTFHRKRWRQHLSGKIREFKPDIVGISCTSLYLNYIRAIAAEIKGQFGLPIVCGGYHASLMPEETLAMPEVDAVCIGDGELSLTEYLDALERKQSPSGIKGIWTKNNGDIQKNPLRELIQDIDSLPIPDYELWEDIDDYLYFNQLLYFIGNRGCPFSCTYCSEQPLRQLLPGVYLRTRNPRGFAQEIKLQWDKYKNRNMKLAHTFDPVFTIDPKWVNEFCSEYIKLGLDKELPFSFFTRGDLVDEERIKILAQAGGRIARIGIESGSEDIRNRIYEKSITNNQFRDAVRLCKNYGLKITGYYILGGPDETKITLSETFAFAKELDVHRPIFFIYQPLPKTRAVDKLLQSKGGIDYKRMLKVDSLHHASVIHTKDLNCWSIQLFQYKCFLFFIGKRVFKLIKRQKFMLFKNFSIYMFRALKRGVPIWYAVAYFIVCCEENLIT